MLESGERSLRLHFEFLSSKVKILASVISTIDFPLPEKNRQPSEMGLAGVKKSTRIGLDPRNTKWINNENGIGHKLLSAQGWTPGQGLGDSMKGRTINIKTTYKDDTAGIGCGAQHAQEWSGLSAFNDIFARINNEDIVASGPVDAGLKNKDRVIFMETKEKRLGLDVRFVKGEVFTSELSKAKFLESLGVRPISPGVTTEKVKLKEAKKAAKAARRAERMERRLGRKSAGIEKSKKKDRKRSRDRTTKKDSEPGSETSSEVESTEKSKASIDLPAPSRPVHGRFASRAKYQRAKLGSRMDSAQLAEILGIKQT